MSKLTDTVPFVYQVQESAGKPFIVRGVFQRAEAKNHNGRVYPRALWEKLLSDKAINEALQRRRMLGELDHPNDGEVKLSRVSHLVTELQMTEDGTVIGAAEVLDTPPGQVLKELFRRKAEIGISSRGSGSVLEEDGTEVVQEDFELQTFDFVSQPSTFGAYPKVVTESKTTPQEKQSMANTPEQRFRALREEASSILSKKVSLMTESDRREVAAKSEDLTIQLGRLSEEDSGYRPLAEELITKLSRKRQSMESAIAPPSVDKLVAASEAVIRELTRQARIRERAAFAKGAAKTKAVMERLNSVSARAKAFERRYSAACAVGEELVKRVKKSSVREAVAKLLASPRNRHLVPLRPMLEKCKTVKEVKAVAAKVQAPKFSPRPAPRARRVEGKRLPLPPRKPTQIRENRVAPPTRVSVDADVSFLTKRFGLRY